MRVTRLVIGDGTKLDFARWPLRVFLLPSLPDSCLPCITGEAEGAIWELQYLRRFGFDKKYFSFEGRRSSCRGWLRLATRGEHLDWLSRGKCLFSLQCCYSWSTVHGWAWHLGSEHAQG